ncbi:uncharacterized protein BO96DRAFT_1102 [Aspergillus niger CBS 101883]|uniref:uncharacterized protein n=1 Tax=Aspergillus lacticoffeatus (strain CBS 101883) TaxID=1450533 RepID=UPI000D7FA767|nr:uncharacterized protein BO96DRAFT_1102 [Aspergillus niger CBS 101883]PYH61731.1 hypothetical protein BO96DRAFT_1102 [Aspergillus niger CBS 101883]
MPIISLRDFCPSDLSNTELTFRENQFLHLCFYIFPFFSFPPSLFIVGAYFPSNACRIRIVDSWTRKWASYMQLRVRQRPKY